MKNAQTIRQLGLEGKTSAEMLAQEMWMPTLIESSDQYSGQV